MAIKRVVSTDFWTDNKVVEMFSPEDKLFMLYLLTNPHATLLGIYPLSIKIAAFEIGFSQEAVKVLIDRFETKYGIILYSAETNEIAVLNWLKHSIIKGGKPVMDGLESDVKRLKNKQLLAAVVDGLQGDESLVPTVKEFVAKYTANDVAKEEVDTSNTVGMVLGMGMDMDMELRGRYEGRYEDVTLTASSDEQCEERSKEIDIVYDVIQEYNRICKSLPEVRAITDKRKKAIKARWKENGKSLKFFIDYFQRVEDSNFLSGRSGKDWKANFDWVMNPTNMAKVLEGNYDNKQTAQQSIDIWGNALTNLYGGE